MSCACWVLADAKQVIIGYKTVVFIKLSALDTYLALFIIVHLLLDKK